MKKLSRMIVSQSSFGLAGFGLALALMMPGISHAADRQLVMFSSQSCIYCQVFNRDVKPGYKWSQQARKAPLSEVDIDREGTGGYSLRRKITMTPTFIMFRRGREIARFNGYPGKKSFYKMVDQMVKR